ncbi:MAG: hypothetical protein SOY38_05565 [Sodaliphilus sp.]|nr:hypothetical protein [Bacteroidales bacterium]MDY2711393.1 hypothetical protein [Sodaliphilus sp.]MDD7230458.1 hypothetical protein [Bacteroidales bacterium]MDD7501347.1 hypothetical protein [Bacteroidales bacterium]MDD7653653.1 hypothetical protein [Bacteroidales bacterium]
MIDVAKLAHCIAEAQRQFGDSLQLTQIQRDSTDFFDSTDAFRHFLGSVDKFWGHRNKKHKKPLAFGEKPNPVGT